jgi:alpha-mannosidase
MQLARPHRLYRLEVRLDELTSWRRRAVRPVEAWRFDGAPLALGSPWPEVAGGHVLEAEATVPDDWPLDDVRLALDVGGESLVTLSAPEASASWGLDPNHTTFPVPGRRFAIRVEAVARRPFGEPVREPRLARAELVWTEPAVEKLHLLLRQIREAAEVLGEHEAVDGLLDLGEAALRDLDWPSETQTYLGRTAATRQRQVIWQAPSVIADPPPLNQAERARVAAVYDAAIAGLAALRHRYPPQGSIAVTGHAHIDLAWLWPYAETRRKLRRTFHTAANLLGEDQAFRFNQSTAAYYAQLEQDDPALLERIRALAAEGRWETVGGLWVEPDTNMPTGESLVRQVLYGQRYFERVFGHRHAVCWLPDCFGFSAALPQILKQGGLTSFFTIKVNWSETNRYPADLFWWQGLDGSRILAHTFDNPEGGYNGNVTPNCAHATWKNFRGKTIHDESLLAVGYGDGGGGVTPEMLARLEQLQHFPALPRLQWSRVDAYFASAHERAVAVEMPVWQGELLLEGHRATLTTQAATKALHRRAERALITAETVAGLAHLLGGPAPTSLEPHWRVVLKNEFHDILPGSSIAEVYADAGVELAAARAAGEAAETAALDHIAANLPAGALDDGILVVNPTLSPRPIDLRLDDEVFSAPLTVPALSARVVARADLTPEIPVVVTPATLENRHLKATIGPDGTVTSLILKAGGREAIAGRANQLWAYRQDKPRNWDAWDIEEDYWRSGEEVTEIVSIAIATAAPTHAAIRVVKRWRHSTITQTYTLTAVSRRLDIVTEIDWHDRRALLRVLHPVAVLSEHAVYECAFGVVRRTTHDNTSWDWARFEVPAHRFAALEEPNFGVALLNDGKYGHSTRGNILGLSLVRGPIYPDPLADEGRHAFTYSLMPYAGAWHEAGVLTEAEALNRPLPIRAVAGLKPGVYGTVTAQGTTAALAALKPAEDGDGLILRVYEPAGARGAFRVTPPPNWAVSGPLSILEEPIERAGPTDLLPFEIRSWRLRRG